MKFLIDGYNLIFQCGLEGRQRNPQTLEKARDRLLSILSKNLPSDQRKATTVVFDAQRLPLQESSVRTVREDIVVLYSVGYPDADTLIEELIARHNAPKQLTVVSSDHRIQTAATRRRATAIDSDHWLDWLELQPRQSATSDQTVVGNKAIPDDLVAVDWVAEFGDFVEPPSLESDDTTDAQSTEIKPGLTAQDLEPNSFDELETTFQEMDWDWLQEDPDPDD